ncbi:MAG: hypothetical protein Q7U54_08210 [Bacteroidales bacterium]|nr:hypothetical protein [Bacteroidales bacterium]
MKKLTCLTLLLFGLQTLGNSTSTIYQASWQTKPVVVDGIPSEWSLPLRYSDSESGLQYNVTNDETNLYICIRATEQPIQMKILSSGMEIWLDPSGKNKEAVCVNFPLPGKYGQKPITNGKNQEITKGGNPGRINLAEEYQLQKPQLTLSGFLPAYNGTFLTSDARGVMAAIDWNEQSFMTYELAIPLKSFYNKDFNISKDNPVVGLKINIDALAGQGNGSGRGGMQGGAPGGGGKHQGGGGGKGGGGTGGSPGGGMGAKPQSPDGQASSSLYSSTSIKFKVRLNGLVQK